jgi:hypothetical protein
LIKLQRKPDVFADNWHVPFSEESAAIYRLVIKVIQPLTKVSVHNVGKTQLSFIYNQDIRTSAIRLIQIHLNFRVGIHIPSADNNYALRVNLFDMASDKSAYTTIPMIAR